MHDINPKNFKDHIICKVDEPFENGTFSFIDDVETKIKVDNNHKLAILLQDDNGIAQKPIAAIKKFLDSGKLKIILPDIYAEKSWYLARKTHKSQILNSKLIQATETMKKWISNYVLEQQNHLNEYIKNKCSCRDFS
jgi:hypothetical protein